MPVHPLKSEQKLSEHARLLEAREGAPWRQWGPYLSERQWGTVREDYSEHGTAWEYFPHDHARSRAYRWGEDGLAGFCDDKQLLCFALALWNGSDPILKERAFGLTNGEGNHGEDVKEYYFYLDATPTYSYCKYLYKYPQRTYPYDDLVRTNRARSRQEFEYELIDTGIFNDDQYFDIFVEYSKASPEDILILLTVHNRGSTTKPLHLLPTLWFRNLWTGRPGAQKPAMTGNHDTITANHPQLGIWQLKCEGLPRLLFTENETNDRRIFGTANRTAFAKDGINNFLLDGETAAVNPAKTGTKAAAYYLLDIPAAGSATVRLRLQRAELDDSGFDASFDEIFARCRAEANAFYNAITPTHLDQDGRSIFRQAIAGMLWSKQHYHFDLARWLTEHHAFPVSGSDVAVRNADWAHMLNDQVISMPDKWEYPWYASWDLGFHCLALVLVDPDFAKQQLELMLHADYIHPNGQLPAYEWGFGDVNPPVHPWAAFFVYEVDKARNGGIGDTRFLGHVFQKLIANFTWWSNRKDPSGRNVFQGGFLGLDNIGVFDRSAPLPTGGHMDQADGTGWMALYAQTMLQIAVELAEHDPVYEHLALKFFEHSMWIGSALGRMGDQQDDLWDEEDGFFYDVLRLPDGSAQRLKVRSMVGLLPLCAATVFERSELARVGNAVERGADFLARFPQLVEHIVLPSKPGHNGRTLLAVLNEERLRRVLHRMLDEEEFLSPFGIRSLSRFHRDHPFRFQVGERSYFVGYHPAESESGSFGGNSNWRGPVWMPMNLLIVRALLNLYRYYGDKFTIECPTGSGRCLTLLQVAAEISRRIFAIFHRGPDGTRPLYGGIEKFQNDPHWRDLVLFHEYFHGDNGAGIGASHQTGWTGCVSLLSMLTGSADVMASAIDGSRDQFFAALGGSRDPGPSS
ncbi:MAG: glucosidase [Acetobacteraceae bacterium]